MLHPRVFAATLIMTSKMLTLALPSLSAEVREFPYAGEDSGVENLKGNPVFQAADISREQ